MKRALSVPVVCLLLWISATANAKTSGPSDLRQFATPADAGYDAKTLADAQTFADQAGSAAVVVLADGHVLAAWGAVDHKLELHSVRKSLYSALWGIAEAKGLVDLDATLADLGIDDLQPLTADEKKARLRDLLFARSGVYHPSAYAPSDMRESMPARGSHAPDTFWFYNNWDFNVAGVMLETVAKKPLGALFGEWIAHPIGMQDYRAEDVFRVREPRVSRFPALTVRMSARDLARFGQLWLQEGRWSGKQVIPAAWIRAASTSASDAGQPGEGYGAMWWTYAAGSLNATRYPSASRQRFIVARGTGGQMIAVAPEANVVIVHRADTDNGRNVKGSDVWTLVERILSAKKGSAVKQPKLTAMTPQPFSSPQPRFPWPEAITLEAARLQALAGDYELRPGLTASLFLHEGRLYAFMPGQGEAELLAASPTEFFLHVDPTVRIRFEDDDRVVRVTMGGRELAGRKK